MHWDIFWESLKERTLLQNEEREPRRLSSIFEQKPQQREEDDSAKQVYSRSTEVRNG
jgi:hypothetical protein